MRKLLILSVLPIIMVCTKATEPIPVYPFDVAVRIMGTDSLYFSGSYGNTFTSMDVDGMIPKPILIGDLDYVQYTTSIDNSQDEVFAHFSKEQAAGTLTVQIGLPPDYGFESKKEASTTASYGSVSISWKP
jgi:hypothetical protein